MTHSLSKDAAFALDLAKERDGYLAPASDVIDELRRQGLVTTQNIGDGFMIVRAIVRPRKRRTGRGQWFWPQDAIDARPPT